MKKKMRQSFILTLILCFGISCSNKKTNDSSSLGNEATEDESDIPVYNFDGLEPLLYRTNNKTVVINFWAMWCGPCVKELPYLQEYANKNVDVELILISLDFPEDIETKLKPFLLKHNISTKVVLLDDSDANTWINKIDPNWSGAIPFTIVFNDEKRMYYERPFESLEDLESEIHKNFNK